jgi:hypothetical protein
VASKYVVVAIQFKEAASSHRVVSDMLQDNFPESDLLFAEELGEASIPLHSHDMGFLTVPNRSERSFSKDQIAGFQVSGCEEASATGVYTRLYCSVGQEVPGINSWLLS